MKGPPGYPGPRGMPGPKGYPGGVLRVHVRGDPGDRGDDGECWLHTLNEETWCSYLCILYILLYQFIIICISYLINCICFNWAFCSLSYHTEISKTSRYTFHFKTREALTSQQTCVIWFYANVWESYDLLRTALRILDIKCRLPKNIRWWLWMSFQTGLKL